MDQLCERFLRKLGIEDLEAFQNCSLKVNKNDDEEE